LTNLAAGQSFTVGTFIGGAGTTGTKPLLIRAAGPALVALGVGGAHSDPKMDVFSGQTVIASNDNWGGTSGLIAAYCAVGAGGPALAAAPFNIGSAMADPKLDLYSGQTVVASNDDWGTPVGPNAASAAQLGAAFSGVGAFGFPTGSRDAALLVSLPPGNYTA